jgi:hypothetical protein
MIYLHKIGNLIKENIWLLLILFFAAAIRIYGIYFDFPYGTNYVNDELDNMMQLFNVLEANGLSSVSHYPGLLTMLYAPAVLIKSIYLILAHHLDNIAELKNFILINGLGYFYILTRWFSVFFGVASVYLIYKIFNLIGKNRFLAYLASLTAAVMVNSVFLSHWGKAHSAVVFFLLWSLFYALKFEINKKTSYLYSSSFLAACSLGVHYIGISAVVFPLLAVGYNYKGLGWKKIVNTGLIGFFSGAFFYALNFLGVISMFKYIYANNYSETSFSGLIKTSIGERLIYLFRDSFYLEPVLFCLAVIVLLFYAKNLWRNKLKSYFLSGIIFNYLVMIIIIVGPRITRFSLIFMFLAFPLSVFLASEFLLEKYNKKIAIIAMAMLLLPSTIYSVKWDMVASKNTAIEASNWLLENVKKNDIIYSYFNILYLPLSYDAAVWNNQYNNISYKKIDYIINHPNQFRNAGYYLLYDQNKDRFKDLAGDNTKYVVISYSYNQEKKDLLAKLEKYHKLLLANKFSPMYDESKEFSEDVINNPEKWQNIFNYKMGGQYIEIYQVQDKLF